MEEKKQQAEEENVPQQQPVEPAHENVNETVPGDLRKESDGSRIPLGEQEGQTAPGGRFGSEQTVKPETATSDISEAMEKTHQANKRKD